MFFINRYCLIRNFSVYRQGELKFQKNNRTLDDFLEDAYASLHISYPKFFKMDRLSKLGFLGSELILSDFSGEKKYQSDSVCVVLANAHGSQDTDQRYSDAAKLQPSPALFVYTLPNIVAGEICIRHGLRGENAFFIFPDFDADQMSTYVDLVMASEKNLACLAGWVDVVGEQHNVFLYLVEKNKGPGGVEHTAKELSGIYGANYGRIDDKPENTDY